MKTNMYPLKCIEAHPDKCREGTRKIPRMTGIGQIGIAEQQVAICNGTLPKDSPCLSAVATAIIKRLYGE